MKTLFSKVKLQIAVLVAVVSTMGLTLGVHAQGLSQLPLPNATDIAAGAALMADGTTNFPVVTAIMGISIAAVLIVFLWRLIFRAAPRR